MVRTISHKSFCRLFVLMSFSPPEVETGYRNVTADAVVRQGTAASRLIHVRARDKRFGSPIGECVIPLPMVAPLPPSISLRTLRSLRFKISSAAETAAEEF